MAGDVELNVAVVDGNINRLMQLHDLVDQLEIRLSSIRDRQGAGVWTSMPEVATFRSRYRNAIVQAEDELVWLRGQLEDARQALEGSLRSHQLQDEAVEQRLTALAARVDGGTPLSSSSSRSFG
ncbi:hypothetical protein [Cellulomonas triticagri]|uniref:Uncharacterized protein n=1 Tax=Cellulomonas triticagri TaxID=2483352 RepID=A0A3M2JS35_9CELL|nr:hypothetical protein [Cellulomonas triticagri]RMI13545.1 hypothetical protein EBM89_03800 [Cellulomonas triticagri]